MADLVSWATPAHAQLDGFVDETDDLHLLSTMTLQFAQAQSTRPPP